VLVGYCVLRMRMRMSQGMKPITIDADPVEQIEVNLVGVPYQINPPKAALAMRLAVEAKTMGEDPSAVNAVMDSWMDKAFGKSTAKAVRKRLEDDKDLLDIQHVMLLMEKIIEAQTEANPTS